MKIVGLTYYNGAHHYTMKCDASLLNQRKPFFVPDWAQDFRYIPCVVARISRLGRCIEEKYAHRYYDAIANGLDFVAYDLLDSQYAQATAFDSSLCVGSWIEGRKDEQIDRAIKEVSKVVTLRMGDLVYIDLKEEARVIQLNQEIELENLYCRIK